ncbi:MAG: competence/damage-inducible protein A [Rikenellaceae bacterium]
MTNVEIITIGDEIVIGEVVDTNSAWISQELNKIGFNVIKITSIRDVEKDMRDSINMALGNSNVVLVTGGLGPTNDDKTTMVLAKLFSSPLITDMHTFEKVKDIVEKKGIPFNENNQRQALVPRCATVIENDNGTAPAMLFETNGKVLIAMPGVPVEMKAIVYLRSYKRNFHNRTMYTSLS